MQAASNAVQEWETAEGLPHPQDPFVQKYLAGRDALIHQEKQQRSDRLFREALSPSALEASAIVDQIRFQEQQTLWTPEFEESLAQNSSTYPGMMFTLARERMERSELWKIVRRMPKGALLHCHLEAMVDMDWLLDVVQNTDGMHIKAAAPLSSPKALQNVLFSFAMVKDTGNAGSESIWSEAYPPDSLIPVKLAATSFETGVQGFANWLRSRLTVTVEDSLQNHRGVNEVWSKFTSIFPILSSVLCYETIYRTFLRKMFSQLYADGVYWVDIRHAFTAPFYPEGSDVPELDHMRRCQILDEEIESFKASEDGKGFWGARLIWSGIRRFDNRTIIEDMKCCINVKKALPHLISGYDFVGQEDLGRPLTDLIPTLLWFKKRCVEESVNIPFFFHAGECLGDGDDTDGNLFDAVLLGTRRIGHGFSLYKHPLLIDMIKEKRILIESCPISNEVLRLTSSILSHPLPALIARGVPCSLSNDDPALLGHGMIGMTPDFWQALQGWENLGLAGLGSLAENSVRWTAFDDCTPKEWIHDIKMGAVGNGVKAERIKEWLILWERFCQWIVTEYGADEDYDNEEEQ